MCDFYLIGYFQILYDFNQLDFNKAFERFYGKKINNQNIVVLHLRIDSLKLIFLINTKRDDPQIEGPLSAGSTLNKLIIKKEKDKRIVHKIY